MSCYFELLKKYGSPLYVYDYEILKDRCNDMREFSKNIHKGLIRDIKVSVHYSTKANSNPSILSVIEKSGLNVDCMSPFEFMVGEKAGFSIDKMLYVCNNISVEEMTFVHDKGILICLDSISQVETWGEKFPNTDIMVRINPGIIGVGHSKEVITSGKETKFGISEENLPLLFEKVEKYNLNIIGTHQHLGSLFLNDKISEYIDGVEAGLEIIKKYFKGVKIVDLGGGFGVPYKLDEKPLNLSFLSDKLIPILNDFVLECPTVKEFKFEPGRYIPCEAGKIFGTVNAVKHENDTWWIGTDIGMNQLVRPSMYKAYHEIEIISKNNEDSKEINANICGNICESGDILGENRLVRLPKVGDIVIVHNAGAYGYSMASNYTGRPRPAEILLTYDKERDLYNEKLIREREDLLENI